MEYKGEEMTIPKKKRRYEHIKIGTEPLHTTVIDLRYNAGWNDCRDEYHKAIDKAPIRALLREHYLIRMHPARTEKAIRKLLKGEK